MSIFGEVIYSYTRAQALEDGMLIDVSETAREAGIKFPVAITSAVWGKHITPSKRSCQDTEGRLWDTLWMFRNTAKNGGSTMLFQVYYSRRLVTLKAVCGPGDNMEPVITIMLPNED